MRVDLLAQSQTPLVVDLMTLYKALGRGWQNSSPKLAGNAGSLGPQTFRATDSRLECAWFCGGLVALDRTLMAVPVSLGKESIQLATPPPLFQAPVIATNISAFDVSPDGKRFLVCATIEQPAALLTLVVNWTEDLKK